MPTDAPEDPDDDERAAASWPDELFAAAVERIAVVTARLLAQPAAWVHRRVETITFLDDIRIRRHMSVDFTLPTLGLPIDYVPLSLVRKGLLKDLDVVDEDGRALPVLTLGQSAEVAAHILRTQAPREQPVDDSVWMSFRDVAGAPRSPDDAPDAAEREQRAADGLASFRAAKPDAAGEAEQQRHLFWNDPVVGPWLVELAEQFVFLSPLETSSGQRRVVKLSYEEKLKEAAGRRSEKARQALGLDRYSITIGTPALFDAESYHVEINPLAEVVADARLVRYTRSFDQPNGPPPIEREIVSTDRAADRPHLYGRSLSRAEAQALSTKRLYHYGEIELDFSVRPSLLWPVMLIALVTTGIFGIGAIAHWFLHWHPRSDAAALIVAIPAFFAAYLVPGEHRLVRRMFMASAFSSSSPPSSRSPRAERSPWTWADGRGGGSPSAASPRSRACSSRWRSLAPGRRSGHRPTDDYT